MSWFTQEFPSLSCESPLSRESLQFWANLDGGSPSVHLHHLDALGDCFSGQSCHLRGVGLAGCRSSCLDKIHGLPVWAPLPLPDPLKFLQLLEGKGPEDGLFPNNLHPQPAWSPSPEGQEQRGCLPATKRNKHSTCECPSSFPLHKSLQMAQTRFFSSVQFSHSVVSDSATPWTAARQASLSITNSRSLLKLMSIELVMPFQPSHPLSSPSPPVFYLSQYQGLFQ